jgi:hypothetical protein
VVLTPRVAFDVLGVFIISEQDMFVEFVVQLKIE